MEDNKKCSCPCCGSSKIVKILIALIILAGIFCAGVFAGERLGLHRSLRMGAYGLRTQGGRATMMRGQRGNWNNGGNNAATDANAPLSPAATDASNTPQ